jgi:hypothetical protein
MLSTQSFYIGGIDDVAVAKSSAFGAMAMFLITIFLSMGGIWYDSQNTKEPIEGEEEGGYHLANENMQTYGTAT